MLYKFKSPATGDVIMLPANGDALLRAIGREPDAKGIIEPAHMAQAMAAIDRAIAADEAADAAPAKGPDGEDLPTGVGLRQRFWPMREMLRLAQAAGEPVVWGV